MGLTDDELTSLATRFGTFLQGCTEDEREFLLDAIGGADAEVEGFAVAKKSIEGGGVKAVSADYSVAARDRRRQGLDNIQKLLDIVHGMNPSI